MTDWIPFIILITVLIASFLLRIVASKNLLEEFSDQKRNVVWSTKGSWSINRNMFNKKGKVYYIGSMIVMSFWILYVFGVMFYNFIMRD